MWWLNLQNNLPLPRLEPFTILAMLFMLAYIIGYIFYGIGMAIYYVCVFLLYIWFITIPVGLIILFAYW